MATESTAIVNLIDLARGRAMPKDDGDDLLFGGNARFDAMAMPVQAAPVTLPEPTSIVAGRARVVPAYDHVRLSQLRLNLDPNGSGVHAAGPSPLVKKIVAGGCAFVALMVVLAIYLAKRDGSPAKAAPIAAIVPAAEVKPAVVTPIAKPETTVTPIETPPASESSELANKFSADPALAPTVPSGPAVAAEESPVVAAAEPVAKPVSRKTSSRAAKRTKVAKRETRVAIAEPVKTVKLGGKGQLSISNATGGDIWVDGRKTTSSRMTLEPGTHNVTLFDKKTRKAKTFQVQIKPNQTASVRR